MLIKRITLENIRSYRGMTSIDFEDGTILFVGDVGSGKSTILMAIEFVLFATVEDYENLLSVGSKRGSVRIEIEVDGNLYELRRDIVKDGEKFSANDCYIAIKNPTSKNKLQRRCSLNDLRHFVMKEILGISSEAGRKNPLYRYAIYTRQGEIRRILEDKDQIKELIRKIFRLDEYKIILENIDIAKEKLRIEKENRIVFINAKKNRLEELSRKMQEKEEKLRLLKEREDLLSTIRREVEKLRFECERMDALRQKFTRLQSERDKRLLNILSIQREIDILKNKVSAKEEIIRRLDEFSEIPEKYREIEKKLEELSTIDKEKNYKVKKLKSIEGRLIEINVHLENLHNLERKLMEKCEEKKHLENTLLNIDEIREKLTKLREERTSVAKKIGIIQEDIRRLENELKEFKELREKSVCPKCKRPLTAAHLTELISSTENAISEKQANLKKESEILNSIEYEIKLREEEEKTTYEKILQIKRIDREISELQKDISNKTKIVEEREVLEKEKNALEKELRELERVSEELEILRAEYKNISKQYLEYLKLTEKLNEIESIENTLEDKIRELEIHKRELIEIEKEIENIRSVYDEEILKDLQEKLRLKEIEEAEIKKDIVHVKQILSKLENEIKEIKEDIEICERYRQEVERITLLFDVLDKLTMAIRRIEEIRFTQIYEDLKNLFEEFFREFKEALSEKLEAYIDENFQPIAIRDSYVVPLNSLSGGEKTCVALSYRLALNSLVKRYLNLKDIFLILDEPTEGFSRELLVKLKDILKKIDATQIIVVSHDRELSGIADVVYRVRIEKDGVERSVVERI